MCRNSVLFVACAKTSCFGECAQVNALFGKLCTRLHVQRQDSGCRLCLLELQTTFREGNRKNVFGRKMRPSSLLSVM